MAQPGHDRNGASRRRSNRIVLLTLAAYGCGALYYMLVYAPRQRAELTAEALRELASAADQVASRLAAIDTVWQTEAQRQPRTLPLRQRFERLNRVAAPFRFSSLRLDREDPLFCQQDGDRSVRSPRLNLLGDPVSLVYRSHDLCGEVAVAAIVEGIVKSVSNDLLDDVGVATIHGDVILEYPRSSVRTATLSTLFDQLNSGSQPISPPAERGTADSAGQTSSSKQASSTRQGSSAGVTRVSEVHLGESDYVIFIEPVGWPVAWRVSDSGAPLVLYGIADSHKLWMRSIRLSGDVLALWILAVLGLLAYLWAFLKLWVMSAGEGFRPMEVMSFALSVLTAVGLVTLLLLYHDLKRLDGRAQGTNLAKLAGTIDDHLTQELGAAVGVLEYFSNCDVSPKSSSDLPHLTCRNAQPSSDQLQLDPPAVVTAPTIGMYWAPHLFKFAPDQLAKYPYPDLVFWANQAGVQTLKLCAGEDCTFQTDLRSFPWFKRAAAEQWLAVNGMQTRFQLDCLYSPNTGLYEALLLAPQESSSNRSRFVGLAVPLLSLIAPTLPPGYGFAVIDQHGTVKFHSNSSLNGTNSFLSDWDPDDPLRSRLALSGAGEFAGVYRGEPSHGYLRPLTSVTGLPWFIVALHSDTAWSSFSIRVLLLALLGCALVAVPVTLAGGLGCWHLAKMSRGNDAPPEARQPPPQWYWPEVRKRRLYLGLLVGYFALTLLGLTSRNASAALWLPLAAVVLTWAGLWHHYRASPAKAAQGHDGMTHSRERRKRDRAIMAMLYTANATLAAFLLVIVPATIMMRHAFELERIGYLTQAELGLAQTVIGRNERMQQRFPPFPETSVISPTPKESPKEPYDRHDCGWFNRCGPADSRAQDSGDLAGGAIDMVARWFQQFTQDPFGTTSSTVKQALRDDALAVALLWPAQINVVSNLPSYGLGTAAVLLIAIVGLGVALAVWSVSVRRFTLLRDLPDAWPEYGFTETVAENLLIVSPPRADRSGFAKIANSMTVDLSRFGGSVREGPSAVILTNLESTLMESRSRERSLRTIESVITNPHERAVVISSIDPVFSMKESLQDAEPRERSEYYRWVNVFSAFKKVRLPFPSDRQPVDEYHHLLWSSCTRNEKIALLQLARDGFVNPKNWDACEHLARRGLVLVASKDASVHEIEDKEFSQFVLSGFAEEEVAEYVASDEGLPWRTLRQVLICTAALLIAFLAFSLQEVFGAAAGSLVSATAALTGVITLLSNLRQFASLRLPFMKAPDNT